MESGHLPNRSEPAVNVPAVVLGLVACFVLVHTARLFLVAPQNDGMVLAYAGFIPLRYLSGSGSETWPLFTTPVTHAFLHGSWAHLIMNSLWLVVFGAPLARRTGSVMFLAFFALTAAAGAGLFAVLNPGTVGPLIGASGAVSGVTAAAARFGFRAGPQGFQARPMTIGATFSNPSALAFIHVWVLVNAATTLMPDGAGRIAWEAHVGGFLAGFLLVPWVIRRN
jgi:membrane associated rhomboid family serine protease